MHAVHNFRVFFFTNLHRDFIIFFLHIKSMSRPWTEGKTYPDEARMSWSADLSTFSLCPISREKKPNKPQASYIIWKPWPLQGRISHGKLRKSRNSVKCAKAHDVSRNTDSCCTLYSSPAHDILPCQWETARNMQVVGRDISNVSFDMYAAFFLCLGP